MQITSHTNLSSFKAIYIAPSGQKALKFLEDYHGSGWQHFVEKEQKKRTNDKYTDGVLIGKPDEYGHYNSTVLYIKDKLTGEVYRGPFEVDTQTAHYKWGAPTLKTEDGKVIPRNVAFIKDAKGKTRFFSFADENSASRFVSYTKGEYPCEYMGLEVLFALENYYKSNFNNDKTILRDKYIDLILLVREKYGKPLHQIIPDIINEENILGRGREKEVYKIDKLPEYALCVIRDKYNPDKPISPFKQCFQINSTTDTDSPIMMNDNGMYIKKCMNGKSHSLPNWIKKYQDIEPLTYEDVEYFMHSLEEISKFPALSYVNFAKALQKLNEERIRIDTINPNNIIIDKDLQTIKMIDFGSEDNALLPGIERPINGLSDMEAILCDSMMYTRYYDMATDEDKEKLDEYAKNIIKKCGVAAKVSNIGNFPLNTELYVANVDEMIPLKKGGTRLEKLRAFKQHFKDVLSKEIVSTFFEDTFPSIQKAILEKTERSFRTAIR